MNILVFIAFLFFCAGFFSPFSRADEMIYFSAGKMENFCLKKTEKQCLRADSGVARHDRKNLLIKLENGKSKVYVSTPEFCDEKTYDDAKCVAYELAGFYPSQHAVLIRGVASECGGFDLINLQTGQTVVLRPGADIHFSKDGTNLISVDTDEECTLDSDISIWSWNGSSVVQTFKYKENENDREENWTFVLWIDDNCAELHVKTSIGNETESFERSVEITRTGDKWKLAWSHPQPPEAGQQPH